MKNQRFNFYHPHNMNKRNYNLGWYWCEFQYSKHPINLGNVDICKAVIYNKVSFSEKAFKNFIICKEDEKVELLSIMVLKMNRYAKRLGQT